MRLTHEPTLKLSIASIGLDTKKSSISDDYHDFVSLDIGVIARHTQIERYRLHLQRDIQQGTSWKLGVYVAHQLFHQQMLATCDAVEAPHAHEIQHLILATGAVNIDGVVQPVTDIIRKLETAETLIRSANDKGIPVLFLLPLQNLTSDIADFLEAFKNRHSNMDFKDVTRLSFDDFPPTTSSTEVLAAETVALPEPKDSINLPVTKAAPFWITRVPKIHAGLLAVAVIFPLMVFSVVMLSPTIAIDLKPDLDTDSEPQTRIRVLTAPGNRCFGDLQTEAWFILNWETENPLQGSGRICHLEIHTENTSLTDYKIEVYSQERLIKVGVLPAISRHSIEIPVYLLNEPRLTLQRNAKNGAKTYATINLR